MWLWRRWRGPHTATWRTSSRLHRQLVMCCNTEHHHLPTTTGSTIHLLDPPIVQQPIFSSSWIWEVASAQDRRLKLSLVRSTLQHWVSRPSCHLAQFPSQPTMMVEHLQPAVKKYQHCPTCTMVAPELESAPITTVAALVQIGGGGNNRSFTG